MKIAIMGIRGIPANYGGFETFAENLAPRLVQKGHDVTVYGRSNNIKIKERRYKGVNLIILPTISHKYLDTVVHTWLSVIHSLFHRYDVILMCNAANAIFSWVPRLRGTKVVLNVDGIERRRKKWNKLGKLYYHISEWLSTFTPNVTLTDANVIQQYYLDNYGKTTVMIPYGADVIRGGNGSKNLRKYELDPDNYVLYISRLEPENNAHLVIHAFEQVETDMKLAIVGDAPYADEYISQLKRTGDPRVKFLGFIFGDDYRDLQQNAYCYVQATEVGGTHPALVEALGFGNCVLAYDRPEHREVAGDSATYFDSEQDLAIKLQTFIRQPDKIKDFRCRAMARISGKYSWEIITARYEELFESLAAQ